MVNKLGVLYPFPTVILPYPKTKGKSPNLKCENGIAECFNAIILEARKKPLLAMLEEIRLYMMQRFFKMFENANKWEGRVCPAAIKKMNVFGEDLKNWQVYPSGPEVFDARNRYDSFAVDLGANYCTCRLWEVSGIPCVHAQAASLYTGEDPQKFISMWFNVSKFKEAYKTNILPVNGSKLWPRTSQPKPLPPLARRMPGRLGVKRKRHVSEHSDKYSSVSSKGRTVTCKNCLQRGHNRMSCKNPQVTPEPAPKKKIGRPRIEPDVSHWVRGGGRGPRGRGGRGGTAGRGGTCVSGTTGICASVTGGRGGRGTRIGAKGGGGGVRGAGRGFRGGGTGFKIPRSKGESSEEPPVKAKEEEETPIKQEGRESTVGSDVLFPEEQTMEARVSDLRYSNYSDYDIMQALCITAAELEALSDTKDGFFEVPLSMDVDNGLVHDSQGGTDVDEAVLPAKKKQKNLVPRPRRPSERIIKQKMQKKIVGVGSSLDRALDLD